MSIEHDRIATNHKEKAIIEKIRTLPPEKVTEVEDFVDFLSQRARTVNCFILVINWLKKLSGEVWVCVYMLYVLMNSE